MPDSLKLSVVRRAGFRVAEAPQDLFGGAAILLVRIRSKLEQRKMRRLRVH